LLVLMSPFDTIKKVAKGLLGCLGGIVKQHFDNEEELVRFKGRLLVIHGENDEVINVSHGKNLVRVFEQENPCRITAAKVYPRRMTHNSYDMRKDIINPILEFLKNESPN
jgi:predicted esterase